jgi:hypothetical protein
MAVSMDEKAIARYLLGQVSEAEAEHLDELSVTDDGFVARLRDVENDLVDAYARGSLDAETRRRFELVYLRSPRRAQKLAFARNLRRATAAAHEPSKLSAWSSRIMALAAAAVVFVGGVWLFERTQLQRQRPIAETSVPQVASTQAPPVAPEPATIGPVAAVVAPLLILAPQTRAASSTIPTLDLPAAATEAAFSLKLEVPDHATYQAVLKDPATNTVIWRSGWMAATGTGDQARLAITLPSDLLHPQHYTFDVSGRAATGTPEVLASYAFEVARR